MTPSDRDTSPFLQRPFFQRQIRSRPEEVRDCLSEMRQALTGRALAEAAVGQCEIVFAEVLNNIVEHAYGEAPDGVIRIALRADAGSLLAELCDHGKAMPGDALPEGQFQSLDMPVQDLPEGGFGWFLIRSMTQDLTYRREGDRNLLQFAIALDPPEGAG